jgi:hypothetical protein
MVNQHIIVRPIALEDVEAARGEIIRTRGNYGNSKELREKARLVA